ncbi:hypothetical protein D7X96_37350 [Corallococcus interemptor]|uniref:Uncharacterized protein n=1 Tax=Corallococcus interemptor TaxID=2316720 RepID=A0A3A8Q013_9BACT|nr:hypothetical protein [Corallococcus interemptor]RKH58132.1 hypothetical protein D7X96_37350 [Corallococcus interemptor]
MRLLPRLVVLSVLFATPALAGPVPPGCEEDATTCKEDCTIEYGGNGAAIKKLTRCFDTCLDQRTQCARRFNAVNNRAPDAPEAAPERRTGKTEAARLREIQEKDRRREEDPFGDEENKQPRARPVRDSYDDPPEPPPERTSFRASDVVDAKPAKRPQAAVPAKAAEPARPPPPSPAVAPEPKRSEAPDIEAFAEPPPRKPEPKPVVAGPARPSRSDDEDAPPPPPVAKKEPPARIAEPPRPAVPPEPAKKDISEWDPNGD